MTIDDEAAIMRRIPLFAGIETKQLRMLAAVCRRVLFAPGQIVFRQGEEGDAAYVVISGTATILAENEGSSRIIASVGPNALIGELAIICGISRSATVRAETSLSTLRIEREHFIELLRQSPDTAVEVMRHIGLRLVERTAELAALGDGRARS